MKSKQPQTSESRRKFLRDAAVGGGAIAATAAAPGIAVAATDDRASATEQPDEGYRLTQHILDYYKSASN